MEKQEGSITIMDKLDCAFRALDKYILSKMINIGYLFGRVVGDGCTTYTSDEDAYSMVYDITSVTVEMKDHIEMTRKYVAELMKEAKEG